MAKDYELSSSKGVGCSFYSIFSKKVKANKKPQIASIL
jgi:hypothetical protein